MLISLLGFAFYTILGRFVARSGDVPFLVQTSLPFVIGGGLLLTLALIFEGLPSFTLKSGLILIWMVTFNCIIGYLLYNKSLAVLTALEVNMVTKLQMFFSASFCFFSFGRKNHFYTDLGDGGGFPGGIPCSKANTHQTRHPSIKSNNYHIQSDNYPV